MTQIVYRLSDFELYIREDGVLTPTIDTDDNVVELTAGHTDVWRAYQGRSLQLMSGAGGGENPFPGADRVTQLAIRAIKTVPYGSEYVEFVSILNELVGGPHRQPDPLLEGLNRIHEKLAEIQDDVLASWVTTREEHLAGVLALSSAALQTANEFIQSGAPHTQPVWAAKIATADHSSKVAVHTFAQDVERGYWLRPFSLKAIAQSGDPTNFYRGWMPHLPDRAERDWSNRVWDYRWALPALITTITTRLLVMTAFSTGTQLEHQQRCAESKRYIRLLDQIFKKRWQGLRTIDVPTAEHHKHFRTYGRFPMAAVDLYGGQYFGGIFYPNQITRSSFPPGVAPPNFVDYRMRSGDYPAWINQTVKDFAQHWWNLLFMRTGLEGLMQYINELRGICDKQWPIDPIAKIHDTIEAAFQDDEKWKIARLAASIATLVEPTDTKAGALLTTAMHRGLVEGGDRAREIVAVTVRSLSDVADEIATRADLPAPAEPAITVPQRPGADDPEDESADPAV